MGMIHFEGEGCVFNGRAAGVLIRDGKVLVNCWTPGGFFAFPGGRMELMEDSESAVKREFLEELGVGVRVDRLLWICESFFEHEGRRFHELGFYYLLELEDDARLPAGESFDAAEIDGSWIGFRWVDIGDATNWDINPHALRDRLGELPEHAERLFINELR